MARLLLIADDMSDADALSRGCFRAHRSLALLFVVAGIGSCGGSGSSKVSVLASNDPFWTQWGSSADHAGHVPVLAQSLSTRMADIVYDPFVAREQAETDDGLLAHYPATLVDGDDFYIEMKTGDYLPCSPNGNWIHGAACGPNAWDQMIWNAARYTWEGGTAKQI
jgi:hypothetical protein